jgi:sulfoxide reductase heme-binding subunit YedZ
MSTYIISVVVAALVLLIAALISNAIKFEGGANPKDPGKRKMWFWILAVINPAVFYGLALAMAPSNRADKDDWMDSLPIALAIGFVIYIVLGFVLSKMFKNGKLGNWF